MIVAETAAWFGGSLSGGALRAHFQRNINPNVGRIQAARARGEDPLSVGMLENVRPSNPAGKGQTDYFNSVHTARLFLVCFLPSSSKFEADVDDSFRHCSLLWQICH